MTSQNNDCCQRVHIDVAKAPLLMTSLDLQADVTRNMPEP
jgi:hypothetical protein